MIARPVLLAIVTCFAGVAAAQQAGLTGFRLSGRNTFSLQARDDGASGPPFDASDNHTISSEMGYGWFYRDHRSVYFGMISSLGYASSRGNKQLNNLSGTGIQKGTAALSPLRVQLSMADYTGARHTTYFNYDILSNYNPDAMQAGVIWFPPGIQPKKKP